MGKVGNILKTKGNFTFSVTLDTVVFDALVLMFDKNVSALLVLEEEQLVGIFTERDYARKLIIQGKSSKETLIKDVMTRDPISISPDTPIDECMRIMTNKFIRHLPVLEDGKLVGIISIGDVVKFIIEEQKFIIENMQNYITGSK